MNRRRTETRTSASTFFALFLAAAIAAGGGVLHAFYKNRQVQVSREIDAIDRRVEQMFAEGIVEETQAAAGRPGGIGATARQAAGYAEVLDLLAGQISLSQAIDRTQQRTRQLAKRQLTWLRSFKSAIWLGA